MMETMLNTQQWLPVELLNIGLAAAVFFACLVLSLWKAVLDELNPVFWRRTAAVLWAGVVIVALSTGIESFNWPQIVGWVMVAGGVIATATRMGMSYYRQYSAHNVRRAKFANPRFSGPRATGR